jgi:PGF-CTERM protein
MQGRRVLFIAGILLLAGSALAQEEPTVNDSDYDTTTPTGDDAYLDDAEAEASGEPTLSDGDFDTSAPAEDDSYLDEAEREIGADANGEGATERGTPGFGAWTALAALGALAIALRRA